MLLARLEAARQVRVTCLGQARRRVRLVRESKAFQHARTLPRDDPARKERFREARAQHGFSEYALHDYAQQFGHSWLGEHLDSLTIQTLASAGLPRRQSAARGEGPPGPARGAGTSWTPSRARRRPAAPAGAGPDVEWKGLELQALLDPQDLVQAHGLACPVKYVRLVRRKLGERNRFSAQLVCQGTPYQKPRYPLGSGIVGLDLGPSAIAVASLQAALLQPFCPEVAPDAKALRRLDRKLDRQRRANNPANYDERGRVKRGRSAGRCPSASGRCWPGGAKSTASWPPRASAVTGSWPIGCWGWAAPFTWSSSPIERGRRPTGSRSSAARRACSSSDCPVWRRLLAGPSS